MANASGVEAGKAYVRVGADMSPLEQKLKQIEDKFKGIGSKFTSAGSGIAGVGAAATAIGATALGGITALSAKFAEIGDVVSKASDRTGIAASSLSELGYAASQSGSDLQTVEKSVSKMQKGISAAVGGSKGMADAFASIGLKAEDLAALEPEKQFLAVSKAIGGIQDPTKRAAKAMEIFGKSGTQLLPLITSDIEALRKEARDLGVVISNDDAKNATNLGDAFDRVKSALGGIALQIGAAMAEPLAKIANVIAAVVGRISAWVAANRQIVQTVAAIAAGVVAVGAVVTTVGAAIFGVGAVIAGIGAVIGGAIAAATAVFGALSTAIAAVLSPIGLVVAAVVGIGAYATYSVLQATGSITKLSEMFGALGKTAMTAWGGIVAAIGNGNFETAGQIAFAGLEVAWETLALTMRSIWANVTTYLHNTWLGVVESIVQAGANIYYGSMEWFDKLSDALIQSFSIAKVAILDVIGEIVQRLRDAVTYAKKAAGFISEETANAQYSNSANEKNAASRQRNDALGKQLIDSGAQLDKRSRERQANKSQFKQTVSEDFKRREAKVDTSGLDAAQQRLAGLNAKLESMANIAKDAAAAATAAVEPPSAPPPAEQPQRSRKEQAAYEKQLDRDQRIENRQARFDTKAYQAAERFQKNHPEQYQRAMDAQMAAGSITSESGGSAGTFLSGVAGSITGGGISPMLDVGERQLETLQSMDSRLRDLAKDEDY